MNIVEKSLKIALKAYSGKKDKAGKIYILHPLRIMAKMESDDERSVALLHDVIEDSDYTSCDLLNEGIPAHIVEAVQTLTSVEGESYDLFVDRVLKNRLATKIKIADIEDNINILRLNSVTEKDLERISKYHKAWVKLSK